MPTIPTTFSELVYLFINLINTAVPVVAGLAFLAFLFGLVKFISKSGNDKSIAEGKGLMIWGLVALFVMLSYMGIIRFFQRDLEINNQPSSFLKTDGGMAR